jgi:hypothetical protein
VAHVDGRAELGSARSTISMARSTPAQKPRGSASSARRARRAIHAIRPLMPTASTVKNHFCQPPASARKLKAAPVL